MADAITIKALQDASLDAKSLEEVVNGDEAKQVTTRKGETYPSVKKAIKQMFENGGLPATPFQTKALMTASALVDGTYAVVTDDTDNNGLYIKESGAWIKSGYDELTNVFAEIAASSAISDSNYSRLSKESYVPVTPKPISPMSFYKDRLLSYMDNSAIKLNSDNNVVITGVFSKLLLQGKYPLPTVSNITTGAILSNNEKISYQYPQALDYGEVANIDYGDDILTDIINSDNFVYYAVGKFGFSISFKELLIDTPTIRLRSGSYSTGPNAGPSFILQLLNPDDGLWFNSLIWNIDKDTVNESGVKILDNEVSTLALEISNKDKTVRLLFNGKLVKPEVVEEKDVVFNTAGSLKAEHHRIDAPYGIFATAFIINATAESTSLIGDYLSRPLYSLPEVHNQRDAGSKNGRDRYFKNALPRPTTLLGGWNIEGAEYIKQNHTKGPVKLGNAPVFNIPDSPNVAPWNGVHDRKLIDGSVTRLCVMPHPDEPTNTNRVIMLAGAIYYVDGVSRGVFFTTAYESSDGGMNFTRKQLSNPHTSIPSTSTSTVNNIVINEQTGRYLYVGDSFPDGYKPEGAEKSYKYFFLSETTRRIYGCTDVFNFATYDTIYMKKHSVPAVLSNGMPHNPETTRSYMQNFEGLLGAPVGCEEKQLGYDEISGRFFRVLKVNDTSLDNVPAKGEFIQDLLSRNLVITWSEKGDITRWGGFKELLPARRGYYQYYDLDIVKLRPNYWLIFAFRYTSYITNQTGLDFPYFDQNERMDVDLFVSNDQLQNPPVLIRERWLSNSEKDWASGTLWAFGHPFNKNLVYVNGAKGAHGGVLEGEDYKDYIWKVGVVDYNFPTYLKSDTINFDGSLKSRPMDGSKVDKVRLISGGGYFDIRVLDLNGNIIDGMDFNDFVYDPVSQLISWNGIRPLPHQIVQLEVRSVGGNFGGVYPMIEAHRFF